MRVSYVEHSLKFKNTLCRDHCMGVVVAGSLDHFITISLEITDSRRGVIASKTHSDGYVRIIGRASQEINHRSPNILAGMRQD